MPILKPPEWLRARDQQAQGGLRREAPGSRQPIGLNTAGCRFGDPPCESVCCARPAAALVAAAGAAHHAAARNRPENAMTAFNAVRFKVKPGRDQEFLDAHRNVHAEWAGLRHVNMIKTGER